MKKIAIIGSNSFIGKEFIKKHYSCYSIDQYSYNPKKNQIVNTEILKNYRIYDVILFLSHAKKNDAIKKILLFLSRKFNNKIIYISTLSMCSLFNSTYTQNKLEEEKIVEKFNRWSIIRTGFVDYSYNNSYSSIFSDKKGKKIMFLIGGNLKTYFIFLPNLLKFINNNINSNDKNKKYLIFDSVFTIIDYFRIKRFKGFSINIYIPKLFFLSKLFNFSRHFFPSFVQSFFSLYFMKHDIDADKSYILMKKNNFFYRRIIFFDFFKANRGDMPTSLIFLKSIYREIISKHSLDEYLHSNNTEKFIYHLRICELQTLRNLSYERNSKKILFKKS